MRVESLLRCCVCVFVYGASVLAQHPNPLSAPGKGSLKNAEGVDIQPPNRQLL